MRAVRCFVLPAGLVIGSHSPAKDIVSGNINSCCSLIGQFLKVSTVEGEHYPFVTKWMFALLPCRSKIGISRAGGSRSRAGVSGGASGHHGGGVGGIRVFLNGVNVTPQSLLTSSLRSTEGKRTPEAAAGRRKASGEGPVKRPSGGGVAPRKKSSLSVEARQNAVARAEGGQSGGSGGAKSPAGRRKRAGEGVAEDGGLTEEDLNAPITIGLCETPTMMLLEIRGSAVATDLRDFGRCSDSNPKD